MNGPGRFLGAERVDPGEWRFCMGRDLHGAFGGVFGGAVAAASIHAAREAAPGRRPLALDCTFVRGLAGPVARVTAVPVHEGRSLCCVAVDVHDEESQRLATRATVTLADPDALVDIGSPPATARFGDYATGQAWPKGMEHLAPIVARLEPRLVGRDDRGGVATSIPVPWEGEGDAEAACLAADACVGPPLALLLGGRTLATPNPDLSVRFSAGTAAGIVTGVGRVERAGGGVAVLTVEVWSDGQILATGVSSALFLDR